jgi:hypothetical protein
MGLQKSLGIPTAGLDRPVATARHDADRLLFVGLAGDTHSGVDGQPDAVTAHRKLEGSIAQLLGFGLPKNDNISLSSSLPAHGRRVLAVPQRPMANGVRSSIRVRAVPQDTLSDQN